MHTGITLHIAVSKNISFLINEYLLDQNVNYKAQKELWNTN